MTSTDCHLDRRGAFTLRHGFTLSITIGLALSLAGAALVQAATPAPAVTPAFRFNRDIRPILADNCFACHGPDSGSRKAGLRLDTRAGLFESTPKRGPAVVPGDLKKSELWNRLITTDPDDVMPPPASHKELKPEQKERLKQWIAAGAPWEGHWSFIKPERPRVPDVRSSQFPIRNPIDAFVLANLRVRNLEPAPPADRRTLARRAYLDLTGLPPQPEELGAFLKDRSGDAYEKLVRKLMASPQWGEHRARYWLDAARYADTHGLHFDNYREMWPYRDWVIRAFNRNEPFDQFTLEQLAGDLLLHPTRDQQTATGFHRCNMTTNEGGTIDEENLANYANDRVTTTAWVWLGLTANCAACHDHKFDPITMRDFYSMAAFFRNTTQSARDGNSKDSTPSVLIPQTPEDEQRWDALPAEIAAAEQRIASRLTNAEPDFVAWLPKAQPAVFDRVLALSNLVLRVPLNEGHGNDVAAEPSNPAHPITASGALDWKEGGRLGPAPLLTSACSLGLGEFGNFETNQAFSCGLWVNLAQSGTTTRFVSRVDSGSERRGWELGQTNGRVQLHLIHQWPAQSLQVSTRTNVLTPGSWHHVVATYDGSAKARGVKLFIDGTEAPTTAEKDTLTGSLAVKAPLRAGGADAGTSTDPVRLQDLRLYSRTITPAEVGILHRVPPLRHALEIGTERRSRAQHEALLRYWVETLDPVQLAENSHLTQLKAEQAALRQRNPVTHVQQEKTNSSPMAQILFRGQYDKPKDKVTPDTFGALPPMPKGAPRNRLGLAQWLAAEENPLTARVTVNRYWQEIFGVGLVKSVEDFGMTGESPSNPDLLDWLAVEFRESGWNVKHLFELIVTSSTYRQSAAATPAKLEKDPFNRFLSRGPRFRMDAEMVRDYALAAGGLLSRKVGGASVKPYQPDGVWEAVAMPESNTKKYQRDKGDGLYRRSLYTFWKRAAPPASMDLFNAPSRETCVVRRERTNTPLQALATLNDPQFVEAARSLAQLALVARREKRIDPLDTMAERLLARPLTGKERAIVKGTLADMKAFYEKHPGDARALLNAGDSPTISEVPATELAAFTMVANQLMNLDEVLNK